MSLMASLAVGRQWTWAQTELARRNWSIRPDHLVHLALEAPAPEIDLQVDVLSAISSEEGIETPPKLY